MAVGMLIVWVGGYFLSWREMAFINMIPPTLFLMIMLVLPESPYWLMEDNNYAKAR
jgi:hypothetical protein